MPDADYSSDHSVTIPDGLNDQEIVSGVLAQLERLLDRVEAGIRFQVRQDVPNVRSEVLHFSRIADVPQRVDELSAG